VPEAFSGEVLLGAKRRGPSPKPRTKREMEMKMTIIETPRVSA